MNQEIFDLVHPEDADKIRDQLSAHESPDAGRVLDLKCKNHCFDKVVPSILFDMLYLIIDRSCSIN